MRLSLWVPITGVIMAAALTGHAKEASTQAMPHPFLPMDQLRAFSPQLPSQEVRQKYATLLNALLVQAIAHCPRNLQPAPQVRPRPATNAEMVDIDNSLRAVNTDAGKLMVLKVAARNHYFSVEQVRQLVIQIKSMEIRTQSLVAVHGRVTDGKRFHALLHLIPNPDHQMQLFKATETSPSDPPAETPPIAAPNGATAD